MATTERLEPAVAHNLGVEESDGAALAKPLNALSLADSLSFDPWRTSPKPENEPETNAYGASKVLEEEGRPSVDNGVLDQFDPLADREHGAAAEAWAEVESHPPPPPPAKEPTPAEFSVDEDEQPPTPTPPPLPKDHPSPKSPLTHISSAARRLSGAVSSPFHNRPATPDRPSPPRSTTALPATPQHDTSIPNTPAITQTPASPTSQSTSGVSRAEPVFDFQKFLDQLKMKSAEPVSKYLRSFLSNFSKKSFTVNDQIRIIQDFLEFISVRMREYEPWRSCSDVEFENASEAMEKLVMNRLYELTFTPLIAKTSHPVTTDDLERDHILSQRIKLYGWIQEKHLDVPEGHEGFVNFAAQELLKINHFKAPRDKLICILNSCKVIFGLIRHSHLDEGADAFVPVMIYVVLKTNPDNLISNVEYVSRFRNPAKLQSEAGYYLSSLMGAISFIETMDFNSLSNITKEEFEESMEEAIAHLNSTRPSPTSSPNPGDPSLPRPGPVPHSGEESARPLSLATPNFDTTKPFIPPTTPNFKLPQPAAIAEDTRKFFQRTGDTIQSLKPFEAIGKLFGEDRSPGPDGEEQRQGWVGLPGPFAPLGLRDRDREREGEGGSGVHTPSLAVDDPGQQGQYAPYISRRRSPSLREGDDDSPVGTPSRLPRTNRPLSLGASQPVPQRLTSQPQSEHPSRATTPLLDIPTISSSIASIDAATAQRKSANMDTLMQIFPTAEKEVVEMVLDASNDDVGVSLERLLEILGG